MYRRYSVEEIDSMRSSLWTILIRPNTTYNEVQKIKELEEQLRTYMLNGTDPEELRNQAAKANEHYLKMAIEQQEFMEKLRKSRMSVEIGKVDKPQELPKVSHKLPVFSRWLSAFKKWLFE